MTTKTAPEKVLLAFDQGGILTTSGEIPSKNVWKLYGLSENEAIKVWHLHDEDFFGGRISENKWWNYFAERSPNKVPLDRIKEVFRKSFASYDYNLRLVRRLTDRKFGHRQPPIVTAIWTNNSEEWLDFQKRVFRIQQYVDVVISSHEPEMGVTKHSTEFFERALVETGKRYGYRFDKGHTIFFDDDKRYCDNCEAVGIKAVHIPKPELLKEAIRKATGINHNSRDL